MKEVAEQVDVTRMHAEQIGYYKGSAEGETDSERLEEQHTGGPCHPVQEWTDADDTFGGTNTSALISTYMRTTTETLLSPNGERVRE